MQQDVRTTITQALSNAGLSSYASQAEPVIRSLETREWEIVDGLVREGSRLGASAEQVRSICRNLGLSSGNSQNVTPMPQRAADGPMTVPTTAQESQAPRSLEALVDALSERVDTLARRVDAAIQQAGLRL